MGSVPEPLLLETGRDTDLLIHFHLLRLLPLNRLNR